MKATITVTAEFFWSLGSLGKIKELNDKEGV
jgi:hypothetical protein